MQRNSIQTADTIDFRSLLGFQNTNIIPFCARCVAYIAPTCCQVIPASRPPNEMSSIPGLGQERKYRPSVRSKDSYVQLWGRFGDIFFVSSTSRKVHWW